jgi:hypothetical protein
MKFLAVMAGAVALLGSAILLPAATEAADPVSGVPGYLDPSTGIFTARANFDPGAAGKAVTGSIVVTTTVMIDAVLQKVPDQQISCSVSVSSGDSVASNSASGSNNVIRAGSKGTCTTTINFIWEVAGTTKNMNVFVSISTGNFGTGQVTHSASTSTSIPITTKKLAVTLAL